MTMTITITEKELLHHLKLSCQLPLFIKEIVTNKIVKQLAENTHLEIDSEELQLAADSWRRINKLESTNATMIWLKDRHLSLDDFEEIVSNLLLYEKLVTDQLSEKVEPYFFEHQLDYLSAIIYEVVLDDEDLAIELFCAIQEKEISFYDVARQYIQDPELNKKVGYRGSVRRQDLKPEIAAAVMAAHPPSLLQPIKTTSGVHLIFVEEVIPPHLDAQLRAKILKERLIPDWLSRQVEQVEILTNINF